MDKINLYVLDTRKFAFSELLSLTKIDDADIAFLSKYKVLDVKKEKLISYYFRKKYVGDYFYNEYGKPLSNNIYFNISNSKGVVVLATSKKHDIGVDVEILRRRDEELIKFVTTDEEYAYINNEIDFLSIWTSKESLVKCIGTGIRTPLKEIPALPINGNIEYNEQTLYRKTFKHNDYIISITINCDKEFEYNLILEDFKDE